MNTTYYRMVNLSFGQVGLVWAEEGAPTLLRIVLSDKGISTDNLIRRDFPDATPGSHKSIEAVCGGLEAYDRGDKIAFHFPERETAGQGDFFRRVWRETARIPKGKVITYGQLAKAIAAEGAARAVGTALGKNPFPLLIPCHRVIRANGDLGGFSGGGIGVKKRLLEAEGVLFDHRGRVAAVSLYKPVIFSGGRLSGT